MGRGPGEGFTHQLPRASSPAFPQAQAGSPATQHMVRSMWREGPRRSICILGRLLQLHNTPRYSPAQAEFTAPLGAPGGVAMEGASQSNHSPFLGPLGHPHGRGQKTGTNPG